MKNIRIIKEKEKKDSFLGDSRVSSRVSLIQRLVYVNNLVILKKAEKKLNSRIKVIKMPTCLHKIAQTAFKQRTITSFLHT